MNIALTALRVSSRRMRERTRVDDWPLQPRYALCEAPDRK